MQKNKVNHTALLNPKLKYQRVAEYLLQLIADRSLSINDRLPSVNQLSAALQMSKETVLKGLNDLSEKGIIESVYRSGYYIRKTQFNYHHRVFFLLDKLTFFKDQLYNSFYETVRDIADVDVYFHHHNYRLFEKLIHENLHNYTHFVVVTFMKEDVRKVLNQIPAHKRIILDYAEEGLEGNYSIVYQDFAGDIYEALTGAQQRLQRYKRLVLVSPPGIFHGHLVKKGFLRFCQEYKFKCAELDEISPRQFRAGDVYITLNRYDVDDVNVIKLAREHNYKLGKDIGLISYNDSHVKEILEGGITVISSDFAAMGKTAGKLIAEGRVEKVRNPTKLILRKSL